MASVRCLNCGGPMNEMGCKVKCPRCGIFYDCSDGMLPMPEGEPSRATIVEADEPQDDRPGK